MRWPQRGSSGVARRFAFISALALFVYVAGDPLRVAVADPSAVRSSGQYGDDQRAEELYLDGVEKLAAGHGDYARETFQSVVTRYPSTEAATNARQRLSELDPGASTSEQTAGAGFQSAPATTGALTLPSFSDIPDAPASQATRALSWDRELRRNASIQSKLRVDAGDRVFFAAGSAELGSRARTALAAQAQWLIRWHEFEAAIEGHADEPGTEQENVLLSQQRAEAVRQHLIAEGIEPSRLAVVPLGRSVRIATCADADCRAQNRRAVTLVFASGTRERLGLVSAPSMAAALASPAPVAASEAVNYMSKQSVEAPAADQPVGVTR